jgi:uncharacterized protein
MSRDRDSAAPSVLRLAYLVIAQPFTLGRWCHARGLDRDPWRLIGPARRGDAIARVLLARHAALVVAAMALAALAMAGSLAWFGVPLLPAGLAGGAAAMVVGSAMLVAAGSRAVILGFGIWVVAGLVFQLELVLYTSLVASFVVWGLVDVLSHGMAAAMAEGDIAEVARVRNTAGSVALAAATIAALGSALLGMGSVALSVTGGVVGIAAGLRLPLWLVEALFTLWLARRIERRPDAMRQLASRLPFRHDQLIYLPLPGLVSCLLRVAERDPATGKELLGLAATSPGRYRIAQLVLIELQARALERVARDQRFERASVCAFPLLPWETRAAVDPANIPVSAFQTAARDLIAGSTNQRQRRHALERARKALDDFLVVTTGSALANPLARRLQSTANLWLTVIRAREDDLAREMETHPEVPSVFIAGPPLTLERAEDRTLFKGRRDIIGFIEHDLAPDRRGLLLIVGQRRMGKTSLCNYLPTYLGTGTIIVASNFQPLSGDAHRETPHRRVLSDIAARSIAATPPPESPRWGEAIGWLVELDRTCADRKVLVIIDEVERVEDGIRDGWCTTDFLDFLRAAGDVLRHIRFLLLTAYPLHRLGPHWTDRLVSVTSRTLSYLGEGEARELLVRPIPEFPAIYPPGGVDCILAQTGRHPYLIQKAGDDLCRLLNSRGGLRVATLDELTEVFDGIIRDTDLFDEIWNSRTRTDEERAALLRLTGTSETGDPDPAALQLAREGYLERRGDKVAIAVPLFREWIRTNCM